MSDLRVQVNQLELQVREIPGKGDALIFLHFSGANLVMWSRTTPYFQNRYRLVLVDLRGHGKSDRPESGYGMDTLADDILGVMETLHIERAHLVGSSLGAEVGLSLAASHPEKVLSLVCDGALSSEFGPYSAREGSLADFEAFVALQLEKLRTTPDKVYPSVDALVAASRKGLAEIGWWNEFVEAMERYGAIKVGESEYTQSFTRKRMADYLERYFQVRFEEYYPRVRCPILMLPGEDVLGNERERAALEGLCALAQKAQIVAVPGWEHPYGWLLDPDGVSQAILKFLSEIAQ